VKWYLPLVAVFLVGVFFYQWHMMKKFEPSLESLGKVFPVSGSMHYESLGKMGREPSLNGRSIYCGANFLGGRDQCDSVVPSLKEGAMLTASVVEMKTRSGLIWLAMEISTATGDRYHANPEDVIRKWQRDSYRALWQTPLLFIVALVVIPWAVGLKFKT
jgi:hypothetical protein